MKASVKKYCFIVVALTSLICTGNFLPLLADTKSSTSADFALRSRKLLSGFNVGYKTFETPEKHKLAVWYPACSVEKEFQYRLGGKSIKTNLAFEGECAKGSFPVVFYAHGAVGCGLSSFFLTEALARKGYVVAAPDFSDPVFVSRIDRVVPQSEEKKKAVWKFIHSLRDKGLSVESKPGREKYGFRPRQLLDAIDYFVEFNRQKDSIFYEHLDVSKIGIVGHSFGAWTALLIAGADPGYTSETPVACVVALSGPANSQVFKVASDNDLSLINCPIMFQYGANEKIFSERQDDKELYQKANSPKFLVCVSDCTHFDFSWGSGKKFLETSDFFYKSHPRVVISDLTIGFLDTYLKGKRFSSYLTGKTTGVEVFKANLGDGD